LLQRGETTGVFQLEGGMTSRMTVDVAPARFGDLVALMALIRPGPMAMAPEYISRKHGRTEIEYIHPDVEPILSETYGVALYQEQVMRIANVLAGFSMAEGDGLRKAMGKKLPEEMAKYRDRFVSGCLERGISKRLGTDIYAMIERFAGYGFPKAHSAAYAVIAAQTAYLKANHPVQFMAALLSSELGNTDRIVALLAECRRAGITVLPPSINASDVEFGVERLDDGSSAVRFGLAAVKNVGEAAVRMIVERRSAETQQRFTSLGSLCDALDWSAVNRRALESLAKAGALDELGDRGSIVNSLEAAIGAAQKRQRASARGQMDLFGAEAAGQTLADPPLSPSTATPRELLDWEKELLGTYMSDHPLTDVVRNALATPGDQPVCEAGQLESRPVGANVRLLAMVATVRRIVTKTNRTMAVAVFEDLSGRIDVVLFPDTFDRFGESVTEGAILDVRGRVDRRGESLQIVCETVVTDLPLGRVDEAEPEPVLIRFAQGADQWAEIRCMQEVDQILQRHEGPSPVIVEVPVIAEVTRRLRSRNRKVAWSDDLGAELRAVHGVVAAAVLASEVTRLAS
jgi:DNA polymerase-3 subunit alpha